MMMIIMMRTKDDEEEEDEDEDDDGDHPRRLSPLHHALPCCRPCLCHAILGPGDDYPNYYYVDDDIRGPPPFPACPDGP